MPKVKKLLSSYENIPMAVVETSSPNEISGQLFVFAAPTVIVFAKGRESIRASRFVSIDSLKHKMDRLMALRA